MPLHWNPWTLRTLVLGGLFCTASTFAQAPGTDISGDWLGTITTPGGNLRLQLHLESGARGLVGCAFDSLDQHAAQIACTLAVHGDQVTIEVPAVHGSWKGHLQSGAGTLTGSWSQSSEMPLTFRREEAALPVPR